MGECVACHIDLLVGVDGDVVELGAQWEHLMRFELSSIVSEDLEFAW